MKIIAHRGFSEGYPENTLLAFQKAIDAGADGIETDLRLSKNGRIVLFHDKNLKRITNSHTAIDDLTLEVLKEYDVGGGESIATLDALLSLVNAKVTLILEIKYNPDTYKTLCTLLLEKIADKLDWVEVSCFDDRVLEYIYQHNPLIRLHKLIENESLLRTDDLLGKYHYVSYFDIAVALGKKALESGLVKKHKVILWTVDKEDIYEEQIAGLYGIMVNNISEHKKVYNL